MFHKVLLKGTTGRPTIFSMKSSHQGPMASVLPCRHQKQRMIHLFVFEKPGSRAFLTFFLKSWTVTGCSHEIPSSSQIDGFYRSCCRWKWRLMIMPTPSLSQVQPFDIDVPRGMYCSMVLLFVGWLV